MELTPQALIERYRTGERDFAGYKVVPPKGENKRLCRVFENVDLRGINLSGSDISGFPMSGCNLSEALLNGTNMVRCGLYGANLSRSTMIGANLKEVAFSGADLTACNMVHAILGRTFLRSTNMTNAIMEDSVIYMTDFSSIVIDRGFRSIHIGDAMIWKVTTPSGRLIEGPLIFQEDSCE